MTKIEKIKIGRDLEICRILNGMWQVAGGHGQIEYDSAISEMIDYHNAGFTTWDMADIYGPAELLFGALNKDINSEEIQGLTKFVPPSGIMSKSIVEHYIENSIKRMGVNSIDLLQFHWWDYKDENFFNALEHLTQIQGEGRIKHLGLTNFNTITTESIVKKGFKIISHQVQYSILDRRPEKLMIPFCKKNNIKILTYGTLLGGFFSEKYVGKEEPTRAELNTLSLQKYKNMIDLWGGWELFQELLNTLKEISLKHDSSIANIATRFVLDKQEVAGVIIGTRLGISEHRIDNNKVFEIKIDNDDINRIEKITERSNNLFDIIGDCGDEYR